MSPEKARIVLDRALIAGDQFTLMMASTLGRLFAGMRPFWGEGAGPLRMTGMAVGCERMAWAAPGILRGKPRSWVTPQAGYTSENVRCAELRMDCGFTVDGEIVTPEPGHIATVSARDCVQFVRA